MSAVESRLRSTRAGDAPLHTARFLVLWLVVSLSYGLALLLGEILLLSRTGASITSLYVMVFLGFLGGWLPALVLTIAWRSWEVTHAG